MCPRPFLFLLWNKGLILLAHSPTYFSFSSPLGAPGIISSPYAGAAGFAPAIGFPQATGDSFKDTHSTVVPGADSQPTQRCFGPGECYRILKNISEPPTSPLHISIFPLKRRTSFSCSRRGPSALGSKGRCSPKRPGNGPAFLQSILCPQTPLKTWAGTLIPSAQRLVWAAKQALGKAALGALFA